MEPAVSFENVIHRYGSNEALSNVSYTIPRGAIMGLIGPNGSGKSTTLNIITTLLPHTSGQVRVTGLDVKKDHNEVKKRIGYAPEEVALYNGLSAREFVSLSASLHHMDPDKIEQATESMLRDFGLGERLDELVGTFSKGMRRKTLLASAFVHDPHILILDEPLEGLDVIAQKILKDKIKAHTAKGKTVIYSTHILEVLDGFVSHLVLLKKGKLLGCGTVDQVRESIGHDNIADAFLN